MVKITTYLVQYSPSFMIIVALNWSGQRKEEGTKKATLTLGNKRSSGFKSIAELKNGWTDEIIVEQRWKKGHTKP